MSGEMNAGVSFLKIVMHALSRNIALLEDKELSTDLNFSGKRCFLSSFLEY